MGKTRLQKLNDEQELIIINRHLKCWHRWVECRVIYRKLKPNPPEWFEWLEKKLEGTHYSLTEETYQEIKKYYEKTNS